MPFFQVMFNRASDEFSFDNLQDRDLGALDRAATLVEAMQSIDVARTRVEERLIGTIPDSIQGAILGACKFAAGRPAGQRMQITFAWAPAYDWSVKIWEAHAVEGSPAALTLFLEGPYPDPSAVEDEDGEDEEGEDQDGDDQDSGPKT